MKRIIKVILAVFLIINILAVSYWYLVEVPHYGRRWEQCEAIDDKGSFDYFKCLDKYSIGGVSQEHKWLYLFEHLFGTLLMFNIVTAILAGAIWFLVEDD